MNFNIGDHPIRLFGTAFAIPIILGIATTDFAPICNDVCKTHLNQSQLTSCFNEWKSRNMPFEFLASFSTVIYEGVIKTICDCANTVFNNSKPLIA